MFKKKDVLGKPVGFFGKTPGIGDAFFVIFLCLAAFIFFDQWYDMAYTSQQSVDLLDCIFTGKPFDFYGYVIAKGAAGKYVAPPVGNGVVAAAYNILHYFVLAIWELPVYVMNHLSLLASPTYEYVLEIWGRLLSLLLSAVCVIEFTKLSGLLMKDKDKAKWAGFYFISSPIFIYCVIIRNQLDMIPVLFIVLALKQYFLKKYTSFSLLMAFACCFKLMPVFAAIPLLLLAEKRIGKLIRYLAITISLFAATNIIPFLTDPGYSLTQKLIVNDDAFSNYIFKAYITGGTSDYSVFLLIFFLICVLAYVVRPSEKNIPVYSLLLGLASLSAFFMFVKWHPQWILLLLPFITLIVFSLFDFEFGVLLDMALTLGFLLTSILIHLTRWIFEDSIFFSITGGNPNTDNNFNPIYTFCSKHGFTTIVPSTLFLAGLAGLALTAFLNSRRQSPALPSPFDNKFKANRFLFYARSALILIYMLPPVISYLTGPVS